MDFRCVTVDASAADGTSSPLMDMGTLRLPADASVQQLHNMIFGGDSQNSFRTLSWNGYLISRTVTWNGGWVDVFIQPQSIADPMMRAARIAFTRTPDSTSVARDVGHPLTGDPLPPGPLALVVTFTRPDQLPPELPSLKSVLAACFFKLEPKTDDRAG